MYDAAILEPYCDPEVARNCGSHGTSIIYFTSFVVFAAFIVLNLFVGVVLKAFQDEVENEKEEAGKEPLVTEKAAADFFEAWRRVNSRGAQKKVADWLAVEKLPKLINDIPEPLGCKVPYRTSRSLSASFQPSFFLFPTFRFFITHFGCAVLFVCVCVCATVQLCRRTLRTSVKCCGSSTRCSWPKTKAKCTTSSCCRLWPSTCSTSNTRTSLALSAHICPPFCVCCVLMFAACFCVVMCCVVVVVVCSEVDFLAVPSDNEKLKLIHFQLAADYPHLNLQERQPKYTIAQAFAAIKIQTAWRNYRARK
jgi:hypothetical protein